MLKKTYLVRFLVFSALMLLIAAVPVGAQGMTYHQSPTLDAAVAAGDLPPVDQRLPENPLVVQPIDSVGKYGGVWRRAFKGIADFHAYAIYMGVVSAEATFSRYSHDF